MDQKISKHSKSFVWLFGTAFLGTVLALLVMRNFEYPSYFANNDEGGYQTVTYSPKAKGAADSEPTVIVDTSDWLQYSNLKYGLNFKYSPQWRIRSVENKDGYYVIEIDPGARYDNFRIYISQDDYFALSGVPTTQTEVGGKKAISLEGAILGIKDNATYYTFDMGASLSLKPYFKALIDT